MENMNGRYERRNPFSVPEGYFDTLEDKIMERVAELNKSASGKLMAFIRPYIGMAATFLVTLFVLHLIVSYVDGDASSTMQDVAMVIPETEWQEEDIFGSEFNPSTEEIIEYLALELDDNSSAFASLY